MLPARFPNLLVNGSQGIAVGMATNIPPHNLGEVIDATIHLIDHPDATPDDLMQFVKGPDFPTGASILGRAGIMDAYRTGRGSVKMRATATIEENRRGGDARSSSPSCRTRRAARRSPRASRSWSTAATSTASPTSTTTRRAARPSSSSRSSATPTPTSCSTSCSSSPSCRRASRSTWSPSSTACPARSTCTQALAGYVDHQVEVITRRSEVPPAARPATASTSSRAASRRSTSSTRSSPSSGPATTRRRPRPA